MPLPAPEAVQKAFAEVLQQLAFLFAEPIPALSDIDDPGTWRAVRMGFKGPFAGEVSLHLPTSLQAEVAANFLGLDAGDEGVSVHADDALRELLNVICGHILTLWAGEEAVFNLGAPELIESRPIEAHPFGNREGPSLAQTFDIEGAPAVLTVSMRET